MNVKLGDRVRRGQLIAKIEDREIVEQVRQAEASHQVAEATIRQREADLNLARNQRRALAQPLRPPAPAEADARRRRSALHRGGGASSIWRARSWRSPARAWRSCGSTSPTPTSSRRSMASSRKRNVDPGAWVSQNARRRLDRRYLVAAARRQRRRKGPADGQRRRPGRGRSRRVPRREIQRPHRARVARARSGHAHRADGSRDSQSATSG